MTAFYKKRTRKRFGIGEFLFETTRERSYKDGIVPQSPEEQIARIDTLVKEEAKTNTELAAAIEARDAAETAGETAIKAEEVRRLEAEKAKKRFEVEELELKPYPDIPEFTKDQEAAIASNEASAGPEDKAFDTQLLEVRPDENNELTGFDVNQGRGLRDSDSFYDDLNRSVGIFPKEPSRATITIQAAGDTSAPPIVVVTEFILATVNEASREKFQIFETFDNDFIYFFDRNPNVYTYGGVLYNSVDFEDPNRTADQQITSPNKSFEWKNKFQRLYETTLRGTKCVEKGALAILTYENVWRKGFLLDFQISEDARNPHNIPFSFTFFVVKEANNYLDPGQRVEKTDPFYNIPYSRDNPIVRTRRGTSDDGFRYTETVHGRYG